MGRGRLKFVDVTELVPPGEGVPVWVIEVGEETIADDDDTTELDETTGGVECTAEDGTVAEGTVCDTEDKEAGEVMKKLCGDVNSAYRKNRLRRLIAGQILRMEGWSGRQSTRFSAKKNTVRHYTHI